MKLKKVQDSVDTFLDNKVTNLDTNVKIISLLVVVLIPLVAFYFMVYSPKTKKLSQLEQQKVKLLQTIRKVERDAEDIGKRRAETQEARLMFQKASGLLPQKQEIPNLLKGISDLGSNAGLVIVSFKPGKESAKEFYAEIPISIELRGPYHNIGVFLDKISKMPRIVTVASLVISNSKKMEEEMILKSKIKLKTYRFLDKPASDQKKKKKKK